MKKIVLGDRVKDKITGIEGIAVSYIKYLHGCEQHGVQQKVNKDGSVPEVQWIDVPQLVNLEKEIRKETIIPKRKHGGIRNHPK